jgi:ABC-type siderophore export system fused ATPase/permease subunit
MAEREAPNVIATNGVAPGASVEASASVVSVPDDNRQLFQEVFTHFKSYLEDKLGQKEKQMDSKALTETKIAHMKFKELTCMNGST